MFDNLTFKETLELLDVYQRLLKTTTGKSHTHWDIAEMIDDCPTEEGTIILAEWSDSPYNEVGSAYDRANIKYWAANGSPVQVDEFGQSGKAWIEIGDTGDGLTSPSDPAALIEFLEDIVTTQQGTDDYPLIDDSFYFEMLNESADNAWDEFIRADIAAELKKDFPQLTNSGEWFDKNEDSFRTHYYEFQDNEWQFETPTTIVNSNHKASRDYALVQVLTENA